MKEKLSEKSIKDLTGRKIIAVGDDYITLDSGLNIYLDEREIENINSHNE